MNRACFIGLAASLGGAAPALAQEAGPSITIGAVSDYRFRGVSQSGRDPALQGSIDYVARSGAFAGVWASTIDGASGADAEMDAYGGFTGHHAGLRYTIAGYGYFYPGARGLAYGEAQGEIGYTLGPVEARAFIAYAPRQSNIGGDNLYLGGGLSAAIPRTAFAANAKLGYEDGFYPGKLDWEAGIAWTRGPLRVSASYIDTNMEDRIPPGRLGGAGLVGSISVTM